MTTYELAKLLLAGADVELLINDERIEHPLLEYLELADAEGEGSHLGAILWTKE